MKKQVQSQAPENGVEKLLYRPKEAAQAIGASTSWVYARIADGSLPARRLAGRMVRIHRDDLVRFAAGDNPEAA